MTRLSLRNLCFFATLGICAMTLPVSCSASANPLVAPWAGPYGGVPPFDVVKTADLGLALEIGMAEQLAAIEKITAEPAAPTFDNTIAALERSGRTFVRVQSIYYTLTGCMSDDALRAVEQEMSPKLAAFEDRIYQDEKLFARIAEVYE
jgi:peptidyl-dipeptidase Dcp